VYRSVDKGVTWEAVNAGLGSLDVSAILRDPVTGDLYAAAEDGVYRSSNGKTWTGFDGTCPLAPGGTQSIAVVQVASARLLVASSNSRGVFAHPLF
jgi:hypothetical protein